MDATEQIQRIGEFLEQKKAEIGEKIRKKEHFMEIDFSEFSLHDPELAEALLDSPEEVLQAGEMAVKQLNPEIKSFYLRFKNLPKSSELKVREIRSKHIGKFLQLEGVVRQKSDVRPQVTIAKFECPACGNVITVAQTESKFHEPTRCGCGRKGKFKQLSKELVDAQGIVLEENPEKLDGGEQPKRINLFLKQDLASPLSEKNTNPGSTVIITGLLKEIPIISRSGAATTKFDLMIEGNHVEPKSETFHDLKISKKEEDEIIALSKDPNIMKKLIKSIAPSIYGYDSVKQALLLQLFGGVHKKRNDGVVSRGDIHILLIGDPGCGKSQLLKRCNIVAPKSRYVSGKGASGAGLTAAVVKDEFLNGWSLEAGALVLASDGLCAIDELDKMTTEDRSAMHEALEQQSYHYDTEIMFADGKTAKIGSFVDNLIKLNKDKIINGKDCEILSLNDLPEILSTDFHETFPIKIDRISRHKAPSYFYKITYSSGRSVTVTPEHPVFVAKDCQITTLPAEELKQGMSAPAPRKIKLNKPEKGDINKGMFLGLHCSEGHSYKSTKHRYSEIGISSTDKNIVNVATKCMTSWLNKEPFTQISYAKNRLKATKDLLTVRLSSKKIYQMLEEQYPEILLKAPLKRIPNKLKYGTLAEKKSFLQGFFLGDGFVDSERVGFVSSSIKLLEDIQQILLEFGIYGYIETEKRKSKKYYKLIISGSDSIEKWTSFVSDFDLRKNKIQNLLKRSKKKLNDRDVIPHQFVKTLNNLLKSIGVSDGYFVQHLKRKQHVHRKTFWKYLKLVEEKLQKAIDSKTPKSKRKSWNIYVSDIAKEMKASCASVYNFEKENHAKHKEYVKTLNKIIKNKQSKTLRDVKKLHSLINGNCRFLKIKKIEKIENQNQKWTYDVTVEPYHTFISQNLILHNTVSISKANIQATLTCKTTVLAAANPKFGRFDPYTPIVTQIDLPPPLISRFDLIFPLRDMPDEDVDSKKALHILSLHQNPKIEEPEIDTELLRKYIAYSKKVFPILTDGAMDEIKRYYVDIRNRTVSEDSGSKSVPITARHLEALVRLAEGLSRIKLSKKVTRKEAKGAIELLHNCLSQVGVDPETGKIDTDIITTGISTSQRSKILQIKEIINDLEGRLGKDIPIEDIVKEAGEKDIDKSTCENFIEKLRRSGDIFEPKPGIVRKL